MSMFRITLDVCGLPAQDYGSEGWGFESLRACHCCCVSISSLTAVKPLVSLRFLDKCPAISDRDDRKLLNCGFRDLMPLV